MDGWINLVVMSSFQMTEDSNLDCPNFDKIMSFMLFCGW